MKSYFFLILVGPSLVYTEGLLMRKTKRLVFFVCSESIAQAEKIIVRSITDPILQFSADGTGIMDNLMTTTSIVNSGTLSVVGSSTLGTVNGSSLSLSGPLSVGGNATISGALSLSGSFALTNISLGDSTATTGNITKAGTPFITNFGTNNTFIGKGAGNLTLTTASGNVVVGQGALPLLTTGSSNIVIGQGAGATLTTGSNNIYLGNVGANESGVIRLGTNGTHTSTFIAGALFVPNIATTVLTLQTLYWDPGTNQVVRGISSKASKANIQPISQGAIEKFLELEPVSYNDISNTRANAQTIYGFIAEDVNTIMPDLVVYDEKNEPLSIGYTMMHALLLKVIQKHHHSIADQAKVISLLEDEIKVLKNEINEIKQALSMRTEISTIQ